MEYSGTERAEGTAEYWLHRGVQRVQGIESSGSCRLQGVQWLQTRQPAVNSGAPPLLLVLPSWRGRQGQPYVVL